MIFNNKVEQRLGLRYFSGGGGSSSGSTTPQLTPQQLMQMYNKWLPTSMATATNQVAPVVNSMAGAAAGANPMFTASGLNQLNNYGMGYSNMGNLLSQNQALGNAQLLGGGGGLVALEAAGLNNLLNPAQAAANSGVSQLLGQTNVNGLSPGQYNAAERSLNQSTQGTGNLGLNNATNALGNAMAFGGAMSQNYKQLNDSLNTAVNVAQSQNSQFNPVQVALGSGNTANNFGLSTFNPTQANSFLNTPFSFASGFGNQLAGIGSASKGTTSSGNASGGCFLTTVACLYKGLPDDCEELQILRDFRDKVVPKHMVDEYYKIAPTIAEQIKDNKEALEYVWSIISRCVMLIKKHLHASALCEYADMVSTLRGKYANS